MELLLPAAAHTAHQARINNPWYRQLVAKEHTLIEHLHALRSEPTPDIDQLLATNDSYRGTRRTLREYRASIERSLPTLPLAARDLPLPSTVHTLPATTYGSHEWFTDRARTLGCDDIAAICKLGRNPAYDYDTTRDTKRGSHPDTVTRPRRGADILLPLVQEHLGRTVYTDPRTFTDGTCHADVDGFTLTADGELDTIFVTSIDADAAEWDAGVPARHVLRAQHAMRLLGAPHGAVAALVGHERFVTFPVAADEEVYANEHTVKRLGQTFGWGDAFAQAHPLLTKWATEAATPAPRRRAPLSDAALNEIGDLLDGPVVFADLETTTFTPTTGHIIEVGLVRVDTDGTRTEHHALFDVPDAHAHWNGTGAVEVHHITRDMLTGRPVLRESPTEIAALREFIDGCVVAAHNGRRFEEPWLASLGVHTTIVDTCDLFATVQPTSDHKMRSLVAWAGGQYVDAHRAIADARMLADAWPPLVAALFSRAAA